MPKKKTVKVEIFETDFPILAAFADKAHTKETAEAFNFMFGILMKATDKIRELEEIKTKYDTIEDKEERWRQAQLRNRLPFYG